MATWSFVVTGYRVSFLNGRLGTGITRGIDLHEAGNKTAVLNFHTDSDTVIAPGLANDNLNLHYRLSDFEAILRLLESSHKLTCFYNNRGKDSYGGLGIVAPVPRP
jgi:hypothetical protein